jgi:hypothetical protein
MKQTCRRLRPECNRLVIRMLVGRRAIALLGLLVLLAAMPLVAAEPSPATGPLRVHPSNHRYFADASGKAVFLTGSHTWANFQPNAYEKTPSPPPPDFDAYLAFMTKHNQNFFRLWTWEYCFNPDVVQGACYYGPPMAYLRPGPELALDGKPKFDLTQFDQSFFDRMRTFVTAARDKGIYASVMLFQGFRFGPKGFVGDHWQGHCYNAKNNINGLNGGDVHTIHTLADPAVTALQDAYVRKIVDTVNDLDNVLYEIVNEDPYSPANTEWQYHMIRLVKDYEKTKPHPVGMTVQYPMGSDKVLCESPADWISPVAKLPATDGGKVIINDTDHAAYWTELKTMGLAGQRAFVWKNVTRGYQCLFMDPYLDGGKNEGRNIPTGNTPDPYWDVMREALGQSRRYAMRMDLAKTEPMGELASTNYCLANPGKEYLVFLPDGGEVTVDLSAASGELAVEWLRPIDGTVTQAGAVVGGAERTLKTPFDGDAVLYLHKK